MEVYVYVDYREDKETGEIQFETPEVYASRAAVAERYKKATKELDIPPFEDINDYVSENDMIGGTREYFLLDSNLRHICIYYQKVEVK